jgi:hypothetical protein
VHQADVRCPLDDALLAIGRERKQFILEIAQDTCRVIVCAAHHDHERYITEIADAARLGEKVRKLPVNGKHTVGKSGRSIVGRKFVLLLHRQIRINRDEGDEPEKPKPGRPASSGLASSQDYPRLAGRLHRTARQRHPGTIPLGAIAASPSWRESVGCDLWAAAVAPAATPPEIRTPGSRVAKVSLDIVAKVVGGVHRTWVVARKRAPG